MEEAFRRYLDSKCKGGTPEDYYRIVNRIREELDYSWAQLAEHIDIIIEDYTLGNKQEENIRCHGKITSALKKFKAFIEEKPASVININADDLWKKIYELGILDLAERVTGKHSNCSRELVRIVIADRKKATTDWYARVLSFLEAYAKVESKAEVKKLKQTVGKVLSADDNKSHEDKIKAIIKRALKLLIGHYYNKSRILCDEANEFLNEIHQAQVIQVLLGEYEDHLLDRVKKDNVISSIYLYLDNIYDEAAQKGYDFMEYLYMVLAHEYFHFHHYYCIWETNDFGLPSVSYSYYLKDTYNPGIVIKESLASYFEFKFAEYRNNLSIKIDLQLSWMKNGDDYYKYWPYAGTSYILNDYRFKELFSLSLSDLNKAMKYLLTL